MRGVRMWNEAEQWLHVRANDSMVPVGQAVPPSGVAVVARVDGARMVDSDGVFGQFYDALRFPTYFGWNWSAFSDCLGDLAWLPADRYLIVIENSALVLSSSSEERELFFEVLAKAARAWANPLGKIGGQGVPFNVVLMCDASELEALGSGISPVRTAGFEPTTP
jgi:hypothetical protein